MHELLQIPQCRDFVQALHDNLCSLNSADIELMLQLLGDSSLPQDGWKKNVRVHIDRMISTWHQVMAGTHTLPSASGYVSTPDSTIQVWLAFVSQNRLDVRHNPGQ